MTASQILVIVPARGGSKRLPGKNLRVLGGKSLVAHTATFLKAEGFLDCAVLSTDDVAIAEEGRRVGLSVPFMRPAALSSDSATTVSVVLHALEHAREEGRDPDVVALLQPTSPFRRPGLLRDAIGLLVSRPDANSVVAMTPLHVAARFVFSQSTSGAAVPLSDGDQCALVPSGSMYVVRTPGLLAQGIYAPPVLALEVKGQEAIDIDTPEDLKLAEAIFAARGQANAIRLEVKV